MDNVISIPHHRIQKMFKVKILMKTKSVFIHQSRISLVPDINTQIQRAEVNMP